MLWDEREEEKLQRGWNRRCKGFRTVSCRKKAGRFRARLSFSPARLETVLQAELDDARRNGRVCELRERSRCGQRN